tara:strand:- start:286 stop:681 length:396 start_codon:yes stop_codon:yes gene_type:complete
MIYVYKYDYESHNYLIRHKINGLNKGIGKKNDLIKNLETLIDGIFSLKRLRFQLKKMFSEKCGWKWPDGEIISDRVLKIMINNIIFKYGNIKIEDYQILRRRKLVGIFKECEIKNKNKKIYEKIYFYLCCF